jgi:hypothetical protein
MKKLVLLLVFAVAVAYYFGYEPYDLIPSWPTSSTPAPRVRHAAAAPEQTPAAAPQQTSGNSVVVNGPDGSLANRWKPYPTTSPAKP